MNYPEDSTPCTPSCGGGGKASPNYPPPPVPPPPRLCDLLKAEDFTPIQENGDAIGTNNNVSHLRNLAEFPRRNLVFAEKLGTGEFGDVSD